MAIEEYRGYIVRGHARPVADGSFEAQGGVERGGSLIEGSEPLGYYPTFEAAVAAGIAWAKAWVDDHP